MEPDFGGYATKVGLKCRDGRTIMPGAFEHMDKMRVPLVWHHVHADPENVLGHAVLEVRKDGVYAKGYFNETSRGMHAKAMVKHKDIEFLSIYANDLDERGKQVYHGQIKEVSLVIAGANPGARIDYVNIKHSSGEVIQLDDDVIIYTGLPIEHSGVDDEDDEDDEEHEDDSTDEELKHSTMKEVYNTLNPEQLDLVHFLLGAVGEASEDSAEHSDASNDNPENTLSHEEGTESMRRNVFEDNAGTKDSKGESKSLSHSDIEGIVTEAKRTGSFKHAVKEYALAHGIENIGSLFPDATNLTDRPEFITRENSWVTGVISGVHRTPFSRIRTMFADLTFEAARAKGYITGEFKKEEWFGTSKRVTTPTTIYKKQKLDRDDILDITDFEVVAWLKFEMDFMIKEEIARAILIGDGRDPGDEDKIKDPASSSDGAGIRSILHEGEVFQTTLYVNLADANSSRLEAIEAILRHRKYYKGSGMPTLYTTEGELVEMLLTKDTTNRLLWESKDRLASYLRVKDIVAVEPMEEETDLFGIIVNLADYNCGTDRGGELTMFDDFDIDYNQYKYLLETRFSGALTKPKSAMIIMKTVAGAALVVPNEPTFVESTGVVTIVATTGVVYKNKATNATLSTGAQSALAEGASITVLATPASSSYYLADNEEDEWTFTRPVAE
jgi:HK97 family phage prohead protease